MLYHRRQLTAVTSKSKESATIASTTSTSTMVFFIVHYDSLYCRSLNETTEQQQYAADEVQLLCY
jgi:hypothetical protein